MMASQLCAKTAKGRGPVEEGDLRIVMLMKSVHFFRALDVVECSILMG